MDAPVRAIFTLGSRLHCRCLPAWRSARRPLSLQSGLCRQWLTGLCSVTELSGINPKQLSRAVSLLTLLNGILSALDVHHRQPGVCSHCNRVAAIATRPALGAGLVRGGGSRGSHLQMRANSVEGILMVAAYSVSGMPSLQSSKILQPHGLCGGCNHLRMSPEQHCSYCCSIAKVLRRLVQSVSESCMSEAHWMRQLSGTCAEDGYGGRPASVEHMNDNP